MKQFKLITLFVALITLLFSCSSDDNTLEIKSITLSTNNNTTVPINKKVTFRVISNLGDNIIEKTTLYINNTPIKEHFFIPTKLGKFKVKAVYEEIESNEIEINVEDIVFYQMFPIVEDYTGTWCGYCTRVAYAISLLEKKTDKAIPIAIHCSFGRYEPMATKYSDVLTKYFNVTGFPTALINRGSRWIYPEPNNLDQITNLSYRNGLLAVALTSKVEDNKINVTVKVKTSQDFTNTKLVVFLLENGIKASQVNYTNYYGGKGEIKDFIHNHVLREAFTDPKGDDIPDIKMKKGNVYIKNISISIPENVNNINNTDIVAFVVGADKKVLNARKVKTGKNADGFVIK